MTTVEIVNDGGSSVYSGLLRIGAPPKPPVVKSKLTQDTTFQFNTLHDILSFYFVSGPGGFFGTPLIKVLRFDDLKSIATTEGFEVRHLVSIPTRNMDNGDSPLFDAIKDFDFDDLSACQKLIRLLNPVFDFNQDERNPKDLLQNLEFDIPNVEDLGADMIGAIMEFFAAAISLRDSEVKTDYVMKLENTDDVKNPFLQCFKVSRSMTDALTEDDSLKPSISTYLKHEADSSVNITETISQMLNDSDVDPLVRSIIIQQSILMHTLWSFLVDSEPVGLLETLFNDPLASLKPFEVLTFIDSMVQETRGCCSFVVVPENLYDSIYFFDNYIVPIEGLGYNAPNATSKWMGFLDFAEIADYFDHGMKIEEIIGKVLCKEKFTCLIHDIYIYPYITQYAEENEKQFFCLIQTENDLIDGNAIKCLNASSSSYENFKNQGFKPLYEYQYELFFSSFEDPQIFNGVYQTLHQFQQFLGGFELITAMQNIRNSVLAAQQRHLSIPQGCTVDDLLSGMDPDAPISQDFFQQVAEGFELEDNTAAFVEEDVPGFGTGSFNLQNVQQLNIDGDE